MNKSNREKEGPPDEYHTRMQIKALSSLLYSVGFNIQQKVGINGWKPAIEIAIPSYFTMAGLSPIFHPYSKKKSRVLLEDTDVLSAGIFHRLIPEIYYQALRYYQLLPT